MTRINSDVEAELLLTLFLVDYQYTINSLKNSL